MKERPILYSAPMVRAVLNDTKTQTRRVAKKVNFVSSGGAALDFSDNNIKEVLCPYGQPGDRLWVRETWRIGAWNEDAGQVAVDYMASEPAKTPWITVPEKPENMYGFNGGSLFEKYWIQSTDDCIESTLSSDDNGRYHWEPGQSPCRIRPSIFMPRWASRITLEITAVRVERLQDINEGDAFAEGVYDGTACRCAQPLDFVRSCGNCGGRLVDAVDLYRSLWESINGPKSWDLNPLVWVIEFKKVSA